jgi:hypothetical protein
LQQLNQPLTDALPVAGTDQVNRYAIFYPEASNGGQGGAPAASLTFNVDTQPGAGYLTLGARLCIAGVNSPLPCTFNSTPARTDAFDYSGNVFSTDSNGQMQILASSRTFRTKCINNLANPNLFNGSCVVQFWVFRPFSPAHSNSAVYTLTPLAGLRQLIDGQA